MTDPHPSERDPTEAAVPRSARRVPWGAISGLVLLVYVVAWSLLLTTLDDRTRFDRLADAAGSLGGRLVLSGVVLAALYHTLDGMRRAATAVVPGVARRDGALRAAVLFATWALAIPAATVIVWPWISATRR